MFVKGTPTRSQVVLNHYGNWLTRGFRKERINMKNIFDTLAADGSFQNLLSILHMAGMENFWEHLGRSPFLPPTMKPSNGSWWRS